MAEVKWIKIVTDVFDDEKILLIESMPDKYAIIVCWFKLLCLAGKQNNSGVFLMNNRIAYTDEMLATIFRMPLLTVRLALETFKNFGMVEIIDGVITIPNWDKHQSLDAYTKRKERDRLYQQEKRALQKKIVRQSDDASSDKSSDVALLDKSRLEGEKNRLEGDVEVVTATANTTENVENSDTELKCFKDVVFLTDSQVEDLLDKLGLEGFNFYINKLSNFIKQNDATGIKSHYATILKWVAEDSKVGG